MDIPKPAPLIPALLLLIAPLAPAQVCYVNASAAPDGDGTTWPTAFSDLQDALDAAEQNQCTEIWVAAGTHKPTRRTDPKDPRSATFAMISGVSIYGGFAGTEANREEAAPDVNETIFNGDLVGNDIGIFVYDGVDDLSEPTRIDNVYHVLIADLEKDAQMVVIDGITISHGFSNTGSETLGGGLYISGDSRISLTRCLFFDNFAKIGGAVLDSGKSLAINKCRVISNSSWVTAGGVSSGAETSLTISETYFEGNRALGAGALWLFGNPNGFLVTDCVFVNNFGTNGTGAVICGSTQGTMERCEFAGNRSEAVGGALAISGSVVVLRDCTFDDNEAEITAGGVNVTEESQAVFERCVFRNNRAVDALGGAYFSGQNSSSVLKGCEFRGNSADSVGGAIAQVGGHIEVHDCLFTENEASSGAGIYGRLGSLDCIDSVFERNSCGSGSGGAMIWERGVASIESAAIMGNSALLGGGILCDESEFTIRNSIIVGNNANYSGGGIYVRRISETSLSGCVLAENTAVLGGGIYNEHSSPLIISNSILSYNKDFTGVGELAHIDYGFRDDVQVTYSNISGLDDHWTGNGNIGDIPLFADSFGPDGVAGTLDDNWRLSPDSPCIDAGDNSAVAADVLDLDGDGDFEEPVPFDLDGFDRFVDDPAEDTGVGPAPIVDMGAYEYRRGDMDSDGDVDLLDFGEFQLCFTGQDGVASFECRGADFDGDGDVDLVDFGEFLTAFTG